MSITPTTFHAAPLNRDDLRSILTGRGRAVHHHSQPDVADAR